VIQYVVTGGAGFIGCNLVARLLERKDCAVAVLDDLSRHGSTANLHWLQTLGAFDFVQCDIRDARAVDAAFARYSRIDALFHLAAQVAVTTSVTDPRADFEANALGTFNVLEAARRANGDPVVIYASTNKVYGKLDAVAVDAQASRYAFRDLPEGVPESMPLDFYSPYGCSKGAADQYTRDYARIYGLRTVVFRQSCIYGQRQFGVEDQGWVAWFAIAHELGIPLTLYGDGKQVRDLLHVDDLVDLYLLCVERIDRAAGQVYNVGGGSRHTASLLDVIASLEALTGKRPKYSFGDWRPGDQKIFVGDIAKARADFGWQPKIDVAAGIARLHRWIRDNRDAISRLVAAGETA
jgi:CDP-paratose 2-epimerase